MNRINRLKWMDWLSDCRLLSIEQIENIPLIAYEMAYYRQLKKSIYTD